MRITQKQAIEQGYEVDTCCNPPVAYKGPRFQPTEWRDCLTDLEERLYESLKACYELLYGEFTPYGATMRKSAALLDEIEALP